MQSGSYIFRELHRYGNHVACTFNEEYVGRQQKTNTGEIMEGILKYEQENNNSDNDNENNNNSKRLTSTLNNQKEGAYSITTSNNNINCT